MPKGVPIQLPSNIYRQIYICLWEMPDGRYFGNEEGDFLCAESYDYGDPTVEKKMRAAANYWGVGEGKATWMPGRKVSKMEADDQMERLLDGKIPDEREEAAIAIEEAMEDK